MAPAAWFVDASNVVGSRPDGWWRDRDGASRRLHRALSQFARERDEAVVMVLDGPVGGLEPGPTGGLSIAVAPAARRDAADDEIVGLLAATPEPGRVCVVTSDAALASRARALGASVEGARAFRRRLAM
ncbi:MAG: NYN domain-containing protein [Miltoncostaeaceae bacterium]